MREAVHGLGALLIVSGCYGVAWMGISAYVALQSEWRHPGVASGLASQIQMEKQVLSTQMLPVPPTIPDYRLAHQKLPFVIKPY